MALRIWLAATAGVTLAALLGFSLAIPFWTLGDPVLAAFAFGQLLVYSACLGVVGGTVPYVIFRLASPVK